MVMRIREQRERIGMTQDELAASAGVVRSAVANWEVEISLPPARQLPLLAEVLECSIDELFVQSGREQQDVRLMMPLVCRNCQRQDNCREDCQHRKERLVYEFCELAREIREKAGDSRGVCKGRNVRDRPR